MRLAIISDTHLPKGRRELPLACLQRLADADAILHAGDFVAPAVLARLRELGPPVHAVHGNVDTRELQTELPETTVVDVAGARIAMIHDSGPSAGRPGRLRKRFPEADAVVFGHSHIPLLDQAPDGLVIFNPGSPTERRRAPRHTMGLATVSDGRVAFELIALD